MFDVQLTKNNVHTQKFTDSHSSRTVKFFAKSSNAQVAALEGAPRINDADSVAVVAVMFAAAPAPQSMTIARTRRHPQSKSVITTSTLDDDFVVGTLVGRRCARATSADALRLHRTHISAMADAE